MSQNTGSREALAALLLRLGLAYFLLMWGLSKFLVTAQAIGIYKAFYGIDVQQTFTVALGIAEVALALAIAAGLFRRVSYAAGVLVHLSSIAVLLPTLGNPFVLDQLGRPIRLLHVAAVPAMAAFIALYLLMERDRWSLDARIASRAG